MGKSLIILFGKTGVGKNYIANIFVKEFGYHFYDADRDLTDEMKKAITEGQMFTDAMRNRYIEVIIEKTQELLDSHSQVVLAQGLFKNKQRRELLQAFPFAEFIWVDAADYLIEQRILERKNNITLEYARKINQLFEEPNIICQKIINQQSGS